MKTQINIFSQVNQTKMRAETGSEPKNTLSEYGCVVVYFFPTTQSNSRLAYSQHIIHYTGLCDELPASVK